MIGFFPEIYPDELVYSWFARFYQRSGYSAYIDAITDLYESRTVRPDVEFINLLKEDAKVIITAIVPMEELIRNHTMFPYYTRFLPVERRKRAYQAMLDMDSNIHNELAIPTNRNGNVRHVRYCPLCAAEDRERYGETYIHRNHQLMNVDVCYHHRCLLKPTEIAISGKASPRLYVFDSIVGDMEAEPSDNETEIRLAGYVTAVFQTKVSLDNAIGAGEFLHAKMAGTPYRSVRGQQRNISRLFEDYKNYYKDMPDRGMTEQWQVQKILNGYRWNTYEVCQLAMFLNVKAGELTDMSLPEKAQEQIFDERVKELHSQGLKYPAIAKELRASINIVKPIGEGYYLTRGRKGRKENKGGVKGYDWKKIDREMLPLVEETAKKLYYGNGGRPHRVSPFAIFRELNMTEGRLKNMPECMKVIQSYSETQQHYWAREIIWVSKVAEDAGDCVNWKYIRTLTNMKKRDMEAALPDLRSLDLGLWEQVKGLI